ncbi:hypothetical protein M5K25_004672 [Dendrobium thyrsiflorum]|uniref:Uncharacterized protein n=1 Tax=Dendrobium thyrsiflorum TaxID=117978 RepID=A0ABD0VMN0_DENTH
MSSGVDETHRRASSNIFRRRSKISGQTGSEGMSTSQPATHTQPSPPLSKAPEGGQQFYTLDSQFPSPDLAQTAPFYPCYPPPSSQGFLATSFYPPYIPQAFYYPIPPQTYAAEPSTLTVAGPYTQATTTLTTNGHMLIEAETTHLGDMFTRIRKIATIHFGLARGYRLRSGVLGAGRIELLMSEAWEASYMLGAQFHTLSIDDDW